MLVRPAQMADADQAIDVVRRSIRDLCVLDHKGDPATLSLWLANKTTDNMRRWIGTHIVYVAVDDEHIAGVAAVQTNGEVLLNYVAPESRFKRVSKSLIHAIEVYALERGLTFHFPSLTLDSTATALRFYQSNGWITVGPPQPGFGITMRHPMRKDLTTASQRA